MNFLRNIYRNLFECENWILTQDAMPQENRPCKVKSDQGWEVEAVLKNGEWLVFQHLKCNQIIEDNITHWRYL